MPLSCPSLLTRLGLMLGTSMAIVYVEKSSNFRQTGTSLSNRMRVLSWIIGCADLQLQGRYSTIINYYLQAHLLPHLMPGNGINPHSVVV